MKEQKNPGTKPRETVMFKEQAAGDEDTKATEKWRTYHSRKIFQEQEVATQKK